MLPQGSYLLLYYLLVSAVALESPRAAQFYVSDICAAQLWSLYGRPVSQYLFSHSLARNGQLPL